MIGEWFAGAPGAELQRVAVSPVECLCQPRRLAADSSRYAHERVWLQRLPTTLPPLSAIPTTAVLFVPRTLFNGVPSLFFLTFPDRSSIVQKLENH